MPHTDPVPSPRPSTMRRFLRVLRLLALFSIALAAIAVVLVARGDPAIPLPMLIATALGVGLTVLLGSALMALMFISARSGHDEQATIREAEDEE